MLTYHLEAVPSLPRTLGLCCTGGLGTYTYIYALTHVSCSYKSADIVSTTCIYIQG